VIVRNKKKRYATAIDRYKCKRTFKSLSLLVTGGSSNKTFSALLFFPLFISLRTSPSISSISPIIQIFFSFCSCQAKKYTVERVLPTSYLLPTCAPTYITHDIYLNNNQPLSFIQFLSLSLSLSSSSSSSVLICTQIYV